MCRRWGIKEILKLGHEKAEGGVVGCVHVSVSTDF